MQIPDADPGGQNHADSCGCGSATMLLSSNDISSGFLLLSRPKKQLKKQDKFNVSRLVDSKIKALIISMSNTLRTIVY
jgi:hypothetical protein